MSFCGNSILHKRNEIRHHISYDAQQQQQSKDSFYSVPLSIQRGLCFGITVPVPPEVGSFHIIFPCIGILGKLLQQTMYNEKYINKTLQNSSSILSRSFIEYNTL